MARCGASPIRTGNAPVSTRPVSGKLRQYRRCNAPYDAPTLNKKLAAVRERRKRFAVAHKKGMGALRRGDYGTFGEAVDDETQLIKEQTRAIRPVATPKKKAKKAKAKKRGHETKQGQRIERLSQTTRDLANISHRIGRQAADNMHRQRGQIARNTPTPKKKR